MLTHTTGIYARFRLQGSQFAKLPGIRRPQAGHRGTPQVPKSARGANVMKLHSNNGERILIICARFRLQ